MDTKNDLQKTVLVVDDQPANLKVLLSYLQDQGFNTLTATDGKRALYQISNFKPDIILLDVMMPGIDGFETCHRLKANKETADIPVIFITALSDVEDKIKAFEAGGVDYVTKPFQHEEVLARLNAHLDIRSLQNELEDKNKELQKALDDVKQLSGFIPICAACKKIRDDEGYWNQIDLYISQHSDAQFSHGMCPDCLKEFYPEFHGDDD